MSEPTKTSSPSLPADRPLAAPLADEALVPRILAGDAAAFELLMRRHNQRLFRLARSVIGDDGEAEEAVQDGYVRAHAALDRFEGRSSVVTWLSRIVLHEALRRRRRRARLRATERAYMESRPTGEVTDVAPDDGGELRAILTAAIDALPPTARAVVTLRLVEGLSTRETASSLRLTESNVKVTLLRARQMLFESLRRRAIPELRRQFAFDGARCDRIVSRVVDRLGLPRNAT